MFVKLSSRRCADWWERMDSLVFLSALCSRRLSFQPLVVSCYGDRYFYDYVSYLMNCRRVCKYYRRALLLDAYGHFVCGVWGVWGMISFCCMDRIESLPSGRREFQFHRKLQEMVDVIKGCWWRLIVKLWRRQEVGLEGERERGKRPIISQSSTHHHHIYKNICSLFICLPMGGVGEEGGGRGEEMREF